MVWSGSFCLKKTWVGMDGTKILSLLENDLKYYHFQKIFEQSFLLWNHVGAGFGSRQVDDRIYVMKPAFKDGLGVDIATKCFHLPG